MFEEVTSVTLHGALTGLAKRQRVIADNIANIETPASSPVVSRSRTRS